MGHIKQIFLTGATGYLGSNLLRAMIVHGYEVTILKRINSPLDRIKSVTDKVVMVDVETIDFTAHFANKQYDAIVHTAASYGRSGGSLETVLTPNLTLPLQLLEAAIATGVKYFINTDTSLPRNINSYALSKKQLVDWLHFFESRITTMNVELQYFFGEGDDDWKFINSIIKGFLEKKDFIDFSTADQQRDFIYIEDAVSAYLLLFEKADTFSQFTQVELGSGKAEKLKDIILKLQHLCNAKETKLNFGAIPTRANEVMFSQATTTLLNTLGWKPTYTLEQGLNKTIENEKLKHVNS